jgi:hypothetical protein
MQFVLTVMKKKKIYRVDTIMFSVKTEGKKVKQSRYRPGVAQRVPRS